MNIKKSFSSAIGGLLGIIVISAMISSCQKDEFMPASSNNPANIPSLKEAAVDPNALPYEVIKINHIASRSLLPDYQVTIYSNMTVLFEGRRNTATIGRKSFTVNTKTFFMVKSLCINSHLFDHGSDIGGSELVDVPEVSTFFNNGTHSATRIDYNQPGQLYTLRTSVESYLGIPILLTKNDIPIK